MPCRGEREAEMQRFVLPPGSQTGEKTSFVECHRHSGGRKKTRTERAESV